VSGDDGVGKVGGFAETWSLRWDDISTDQKEMHRSQKTLEEKYGKY
jgi:geranylgeranyl pyrophosphate synthase